MRTYTLKQQDSVDCGITCLAMILKYYKTSVPTSMLRNLTNTDKSGVSLLGLAKGANYFSLNTNMVYAEESDLKGNIKFPFIAHIINKENYQHFVVVYNINHDHITYADPATGLCKSSLTNFFKTWSGYLLFIEPNNDYQPVNKKLPNLLSFYPIIKQQKKSLTTIFIFSVLLTGIGLLGAKYLETLIDFSEKRDNFINIISVSIIVIYILQIYIDYQRSLLLVNLGQKIAKNIILNYLNHILSLPLTFFDKFKAGEIISRFVDAGKIVGAISNITLVCILDLVQVTIIGAVLFYINYKLFLITFLTLPCYVITILYFIKRYDNASEKEMKIGAALNSEIFDYIKGIETIKTYSKEKNIFEKFSAHYNKLLSSSLYTAKLDILQSKIKNAIQLIFGVLILWIGITFVKNGNMTIGQVIAYNALLQFFLSPLQNIINLQPQIQSANIANKRLQEIMYTQQEADMYKLKIDFEHIEKLTFSNVSFSYELNKNVLKNNSFEIPLNKKTVITGDSGLGKSTIAKLILRFYDISEGNILFDKHNLKDLSIKDIRDSIGYVSQNSYLFSGTLLENLKFGCQKDLSIDKVLHVCKETMIDQFIKETPAKLNMYIAEGGENLSGGQKQRIAIARALLSNKKILIFDEITSGMNSEMEKIIISKLFKMKDIKMIFISHSPKIIEKAEHLISIKNEKEKNIVEQGQSV